jgi:glyoxalase family protein
MSGMPSLQLRGFHHLTAITADARGNHRFYTGTLGLRLVKKTVNQDDVSAYHLFYADGAGTPGTDLTFFDWPAARERRGTRSVVRTGLRVAREASLEWWAARFREEKVPAGVIETRAGRPTLDFEDPEGQRLSLVLDAGPAEAQPWAKSPVPPEHQVRGLGPITLSVPRLEPTEHILTEVLGMEKTRAYQGGEGGRTPVQIYEMAGSGPSRELHVALEAGLMPARSGAGGVHHLALRTPDAAEYERWARRLTDLGVASSGPVDRFYFRSLYFREPNGILFEIATDGPGFASDESPETMGERLALPPFLEPRRRAIEAGLKPLEV